MRLFSRIFSFLKKEQKDEDEDTKKRKEKCRKKAIASTALMLMLLVSIYAEPVAAFSWPKPDWKAVGNFLDTLKNNVLGGAGGALVGAKYGAVIGGSVGGPAGAAVGALVGGIAGYIAGAHIEQKIKDKVGGVMCSKLGIFCDTEHQPVGVNPLLSPPKNITLEEFQDDTPIKNALVQNLTDQTDQAAYQDMLTLVSKLQSSLIPYDFQETGDSGEFSNVLLEGPEKIYGFSAFPIHFSLTVRGNTEVKDPICLTSVKIYAKSTQDGNIYWTRTWTFADGEKCGEEGTMWSFDTILKGPDPYSSYINSVLDGTANEQLINEIFNAEPQEYEVMVEVSGVRKIYYYANRQWIFDHDEPIHAVWSSLSAYRHIAAGTYVVSGFAGSLPISFKDAPEASQFTAFQMKAAGASSNLISRLWSAPLHILNATVAYRFYIQANPGYFGSLNPQIVDEARIVVYRVLKNGNWELAYAIPLGGTESLGDLSVGKRLDASVTYHADPDTISYRAFIAIKAWIPRDDGQQIPVWVLVEPAIAPIDPTRTITMDSYVVKIVALASDGSIDVADAQQLQAIADSLISSLQSKIDVAEEWKSKGEAENKDLVVEYASEAIYHYKEAIRYAEKLKSVDNTQDALRYAEIVKEEEVIGDYYLRAAELAYYGQEEQAQTLVEDAKKVEETVKEYKGGLAGILPDFGDPQELMWFAIKIILSIAAIYVARKLFGSMGALIVGALVFVWWIGPLFGIHL